MMIFKTNNIIKLLGLIFISLMYSCAHQMQCPPETQNGNLGSVLNTPDDEYSPFIYEDHIYYTNKSLDGSNQEIFKLRLDKESVPEFVNDLPLYKFDNSGLPVFYRNSETGNTELFFAGISKRGKKNSNIYHSVLDDGIWTEPTKLGFNTKSFESHPYISDDGKTLIFSSDRPGGFGNIDLYISHQDNGVWSEPENLGEDINSPANELSPYLTSEGELYFSSNRIPKNKYDIYHATVDEDGLWDNLELLNSPINTKYNDLGPAIYQNTIYFTSDRIGGCGGKDIYSLPLCSPVLIQGSISSENESINTDGSVDIYDRDKNLVQSLDLFGQSSFQFVAAPPNHYSIVYTNQCNPNLKIKQIVEIPCSREKTIKIVLRFQLPEKSKLFDFEEYDVPFFVTGYYKPITKDNLEALKMKFAYNLVGISKETKYIENPEKKYDHFSSLVETALNRTSNFIQKSVSTLKTECSKSRSKLKITVYGFADPRQINANAKYVDNDIKEFGLNIKNGQKVDNLLLSTLRAYFTARYLQAKLERNPEFLKYSDRIVWEVKGKGIDKDKSIANEFKRRVNVHVSILD